MVRLLNGRCDVKDGGPANAGLGHGFQIGPYAFFGEIGTHPVPPDIGPVFHGRLLKLPGKRPGIGWIPGTGDYRQADGRRTQTADHQRFTQNRLGDPD